MKYICVEGNIGSGKTSLAKKLADHFNAGYIGEEFEENPFLPLFYQDPRKFSFPLEFSFLLDRARQLASKKIEMEGKLFFSDYFIEKCLYFAELNLEPAQFTEFKNAYPSVEAITPKPDLLIFLHLGHEELLRNISQRGRFYEKSISAEYLSKINQIYLENAQKQRNFRVISFKMNASSAKDYEELYKHVIAYVNSPPTAKFMQISIG